MAVGMPLEGEVLPVEGVSLAVAAAGIKAGDGLDLVLISLVEGSTTVGVFTRNVFCAAPVTVCKEHLALAVPRCFIINSGNANAAVGATGIEDALRVCDAIAASTDFGMQQVLPFSTGVIGERLPVDKIISACPKLLEDLSANGWKGAAQGIMTTDTRPKACSKQVTINASPVTITGICKGSGMIRPDMATLLVYLATDAVVEKELLQALLQTAMDQSFNRITVDTDTSTNDSCVLTATHKSGISINADDESLDLFSTALNELCQEMAQEIIKDAEGATKFVEVKVEQGKHPAECLAIAYAVAESPLVKTALFASDANWGRIVMAIGKAGVLDLNTSLIGIWLGPIRIVRNGERDPDYQEEMGSEVMREEEIVIRVALGRGSVVESVWTCDLSYDYVRINAEYRT
jgi:glutamate N-acetyltransferase/amino-acid N-acetyltransferase